MVFKLRSIALALVFFCLTVNNSWGQVVYQEDFGSATFTTNSYTFGTNALAATKNANFTNPVWTNTVAGSSVNFTGLAGSPTGCLSVTAGANTVVYTCTFTVNSGFSFTPTSIGFDNRTSAAGPTALTVAISGTGGSTSRTFTTSNTGAFTSTAAANFASTIQVLTGAITLSFTFTGGGSGGTLRMDNVILNGTVNSTSNVNISSPSQVGAQFIYPSTTNNIINAIQVTNTSGSAITLSAASLTTTGTYRVADLAATTPLKLYFTTGATFTSPTLLKAVASAATGTGETVAFTSLASNPSIANNATLYLWFTADINASPTATRTIIASASAVGDITVSAGTKGSTATVGGTQTISAVPSITIGTLSPAGPYCQGATLSVPFTISGGNFNTGTTFTAQIGTSSFTLNTANIGTGTASPLSCTIPVGQLAGGTTYSIRVNTTAPAVNGSTTTFVLNSIPTVSYPSTSVCNNGIISGITINPNTSGTFNTPSSGTIPYNAGTTDYTYSPNSSFSGSVSLTYTLNGCPSAAQNITVNAPATFSPASPSLCRAGTVAVTTSAAGTFGTPTPTGVTIPGSGTSWTVTGNNTLGASGSAVFTTTTGSCQSTLNYTLNSVPAQPGTITQPSSTPCAGQAGNVYSIALVSGATSYTWAVPTGWSITSAGTTAGVTSGGTNSITVTAGTIVQTGAITVTANNTCGSSTAQTTVTINPQASPAAPSGLTGPAAPCINSTGLVYSVTDASLTYKWTVPSGWSITSANGINGVSSGGLNSITVTSNGTTSALTLSVLANNGSCDGAASSLSINQVSAAPATPTFTPVTATNNVVSPCATATGLTYGVTAVAGVSYAWSTNSLTGWSITANPNTATATMNAGTGTGNLIITATNACGATPTNRAVSPVNGLPATPVFTTPATATLNNASPCSGTAGLTYQVNSVAGVTYAWSVGSLTAWSITGGSATNSATITAGTGNGNITVTASNVCGNTNGTITVTPSSAPAAPVANSNNTPQTSNVNSTDFTANWGQVSGATYAIDVSTSSTFSTNAAAITEGFEGVTFPPTGWANTSWARSTTAGDFLNGIAAAVGNSNNGTLTTPVVANPTNMTFYLGRSGNTTSKTLTIEVSTTSQSSGFSTVATYDHSNVTAGSYNQYTVDLSAFTANSTVYIRFNKSSLTTSPWRLDDVVINSSTPSFVAGYNNLSVPSGITQLVNSNITAGNIYYYRVRAINACGASVNSNVVSLTTRSLTASTLSTFGTRCMSTSTDLSFNLTGNNLDGTNITIGPLTGFQFSANGGAFGTTATYSGGTSFTNTPITVRFLPTGSGLVSFDGNIPVSGGGASAINVAVTASGTTPPAQPTITAGSLTPCAGVASTYSVTNVSGVTYTWSLPPNMTGTVANSNSLSLTAGAQGSSGTISITPSIGTCAGTAATWNETVTTVAIPSVITTPGTPCQGSTGNVYSVTLVTGVTYTWSTTGTGWGITAPGSTTNSVTVTAGTGAGTVTVVPSLNGCNGNSRSTASITPISSFTPKVSIANNTTIVCTNANNTFTATRTDAGGGTPSYAWKINGGSTVSTANPYTPAAGVLAHGDAITCDMTITGASCPVPATVTSNNLNAQKLAYTPVQDWLEDFATSSGSIIGYSSTSNPSFIFNGISSNVDVRTGNTPPSSPNALFFGGAGGTGNYFTISGINTTNSFPNKLTFSLYVDNTVAISTLVVEYSTDGGTTYYPLDFGAGSRIGASSWTNETINSSLPKSNNLTLRFTSNNSGSRNSRIDDIKLFKYSVGDASITSNPATPSYCSTTNSTVLTSAPTATPALTYAWSSSPSSPNFLSSTTVYNPTATNVTATRTYTVGITDDFGCSSTASQAVTINTTPTVYTVNPTTIAAGTYCSGTGGVNVGINSSQTGVNYQLYFNGNPQGSPVAGTGNPSQSLFGAQTAAGTYTVVATGTGGCTANMTGSAVITVNPLPTDYTLSASATNYCLGGSGVTLNLSGSQTNTNYQLLVNGAASGSPVTGTGSGITFGSQTAAGTYTVTATNTSLTPNCSSTMTGIPVVTINPKATAQLGSSVLLTEGFTAATLPSGWSSSSPSGNQYNSTLDNGVTTVSSGYTGASGGYNVLTTGSVLGASASTLNQLISPSINITGYTNFSVSWGARKTNAYPGNGTFYYSTDNGSSWNQVAFLDVAPGAWDLVNGGVAVDLPNLGSATTLKLRWDAQATTTTANYRIDDIKVTALANTSACNHVTSVSIPYAASANSTGYTLTSALTNFVTQYGTLSTGGGNLSITIPANTVGGSYSFNLALTNSNSCSSTYTIPVTLNSVTADITNSPNTTLLTCATTSIGLTATGGNTYQWNATAGSVTTPGATASAAGTYVVTATGANGCTASASVNITGTVACGYTWVSTAVSNVWSNTNNWLNNTVPPSASATNVTIQATTNVANFPVLPSSYTLGNVTLEPGAKLDLGTFSLDVKGNWVGSTNSTTATVTGTGKITLSGSGAQTLSGRTQFNTLRINKTAGTASIQNNSFVEVFTALELQSGVLNNSANTGGLFTLKSTSTAHAIFNDFSTGFGGTFGGTIYEERYYRATSANSYNQHYMGSPVSNADLDQFGAGSTSGPVTPTADCSETQLDVNSFYGAVFSYNQAIGNTCPLRSWTVVASGNNADPGKGYSVARTGAGTLTVYGTPNTASSYSVTGLINSGWTKGTLQHPSPTAFGSGWQLVSNPYNATLDLSNATGNSANFNNQVQVWNSSTGGYTAYVIGTDQFAIAPFQAFFVKKTTTSGTATYVINGTNRVVSAQTFYAQNIAERLTIRAINNANNIDDATTVGFNINATDQFDPEFDANKMTGSIGRHNLYSMNNGYWLNKNMLHSIAQTSTVDVGFEPGASGSYSFTFDGLNSFDPTSYITLEDKKLNIFYDVRSGDYNFTADSADDWNRFVLHFTPKAEIATVDADCNNSGTINITQPGTAQWAYTVTDNNNATISSGSLNQNNAVTVNATAGTYTLTLTDANNYVVMKTITVNGSTPIAASFTPSATTVEETNDVTFNSTTANAATTTWDFGDGITASTATATHAYATPGTYTVTLTVTNATGCSSTTTQVITVTAKTTTGLSNITNNKAINIWSNDNRVFIDFSKQLKVEATIEFYNVLGQQLMAEKFGRSSIFIKELSNLEAAYVIVKVKNEDTITTKKVFIMNK